MALPKITGRIQVIVNGQIMLNKSGAVARGIGESGKPAVVRKAVMGDSGYHGSVEEPIMAECEVTLTDREDISLSEICKILDNGTVIFQAYGGGKQYTMEGATCENNLSITGGEGETPVKFYGPYWIEGIQ